MNPFSLTFDQIVALLGVIVTIVIAMIGGLYTVLTSTKKYELTETYCNEMLSWYSDTVQILMTIIHYIKNESFFEPDFSNSKAQLLAQLSAQIEIGRFYFPNIRRQDDFDANKPLAYQGRRHFTLDTLVFFYRKCRDAQDAGCVCTLQRLEHLFTSAVFQTIDPPARAHQYSRHLDITTPPDISYEDYLSENPSDIAHFF